MLEVPAVRELLREKRSAIVDRWVAATLEAYPADSARFFASVKDPFANPVGNAIAEAIGELVDGLATQGTAEALAPALDRIIKIRCVQEASCAAVVGFVFRLKAVLRAELGDRLRDPGRIEAWLAFEDQIDRLALLAFESYARHRERIAEIRVNEIKRSVSTLRRMSRFGIEDPVPETDRQD